MTAKVEARRSAFTPTTTYYNAESDPFERTALIVGGLGKLELGTIDVVENVNGEIVRLCQINITRTTTDGEPHLIVDVIDVDDRFAERRMMSFAPTKRVNVEVPEGGNLVSTDFRGTRKPKAKTRKRK